VQGAERQVAGLGEGNGVLHHLALVGRLAEAERERLLEYLAKWQENRERLAVLPSRRGERLRIEWTSFGVHIDDKLRPKKKDKPPRPPGRIEARLDGATTEFLVPG